MTKIIKVYLDESGFVTAMKDNIENSLIDVHALTYFDFLQQIYLKSKYIITPILEAIDSKYYEDGYDIIVYKGDKYIRFSDIIGKNNPYTEREIRLSHDWRKLVLNNEFNWLAIK